MMQSYKKWTHNQNKLILALYQMTGWGAYIYVLG